MVVHEPPLLSQPRDPQQARHRAFPRRQDCTQQQNFGMPPTALENSGATLRITEAKPDGSIKHGVFLAETHQADQSPAPLLTSISNGQRRAKDHAKAGTFSESRPQVGIIHPSTRIVPQD